MDVKVPGRLLEGRAHHVAHGQSQHRANRSVECVPVFSIPPVCDSISHAWRSVYMVHLGCDTDAGMAVIGSQLEILEAVGTRRAEFKRLP